MKVKNGLLLVLTSAAVGVVVGLLMAPDEGSKTRKKWLKKAKKYKKDLGDKASEYKDKAVDLKENIEGAANDLLRKDFPKPRSILIKTVVILSHKGITIFLSILVVNIKNDQTLLNLKHNIYIYPL